MPSETNVGRPGVPAEPVYTETGSCGEQQHDATSIVHGLSRGWADTYPTLTLEDQYIDITGLPDGTYVVQVTADWQHFITEVVEDNNSASAEVTIANGEVVSAERLTGS